MIAKKQTAAVIAIALDELSYQYRYVHAAETFYLDFKLAKSKLSELRLVIQIKEEQVMIYAFSPLMASKERMGRAAFYLTCCNAETVYGNFEINPENGEVRYKNVIHCTDVLPSKRTVKDMVHIPIAMFERYGNGLFDAIFTEQDPIEIWKEAWKR